MGTGSHSTGSEAAGALNITQLYVHNRTSAQEQRYVPLPDHYYGNGVKDTFFFFERKVLFEFQALC